MSKNVYKNLGETSLQVILADDIWKVGVQVRVTCEMEGLTPT